MKSARLLLMGMLITFLTISMMPTQSVQAQDPTTSDLVLSLVSIPKHAKACQTIEAIYVVTNLGPDPANHLSAGVGIPDAFDYAEIAGLPNSLSMGESATFKVIVKVTGFVPGEMRYAWMDTSVGAGSYLEPSIDPNQDNNSINSEMKLIGKRSTESCPR